MNIHIKRYGQGIPLVFFHGWGFDSQVWMPLVPFLEKQYELILVDLPGFGSTTLMSWLEFKASLLPLLPIKFALAGWSLGGLFATRLAIEEPARVNYLLNITSSPRFLSDTAWPGVSKDLFITFYKNLSENSNKTLNEFIQLQQGSNPLSFTTGATPTSQSLESGLRILDTWDLREGIKSLSMPTCFLFGRLDRIIPAQTMGSMQLLYPNFKYLLFNKAAHMPFLSHTDLFVIEILELVQ